MQRRQILRLETNIFRTVARLGLGPALLLLGLAIAASASAAAFAATSAASTTANVTVNASGITLSNLTSSFTLSGDPNTTVTSGAGIVSMNVLTNNPTGYTVSVQAAAAALAGTGGNTDTIPVADLKVKETGGASFTSLSSSSAVTTHNQATKSASSGDAISNDFQVVIPFVNPDTYTVVLNYVAATQ
jgi:hypothetical protein